MNPSTNPTRDAALESSIEKWSQIALDSGWVADWIEGAIFPREMVYFLARCETAGIQRIIESGRQDGYSTQILGEYAERTGCSIVSLDYEDEPERAAAARARLSRFKVECVKADAFLETDPIVERAPDTATALLYDGPKGFPALALLFAAARRANVKILAQHNLVRRTAEREVVESAGARPVCYEDEIDGGKAWAELTAREIEWAERSHANRSLNASTLCVMEITPANRSRVSNTVHPGFKLFQPALVSVLWRARMYEVAAALFRAQARFMSYASRAGVGAHAQ